MSLKTVSSVLALAGLSAMLLAGCPKGEEAPAGAAAASAAPRAAGPASGRRGPGGPVAVTLVPVERRTITETLALTGTLEASRQAALAPRVSGRVIDVMVALGDAVKPGQLLARIDAADLSARLAQAEAAVASARASVTQRRVEHDNLAAQAKRDGELFRQDFIARQEWEASQTQAKSAQALVTLARSELARQEAARREARAALAQAELRAPMAGVVSARHLDPGAMAGPGSPVVTIVGTDALRTVVQVPERALVRLKPGMSADVTVDAWPDRHFVGRVSRVAPALAVETRTAPVEIEVRDGTGALRPGMFARVALSIAERKNAPAVPRDALIEQQGRPGVFVAEDGKARFVPVEGGLSDETYVELTGVLPEGARVVTLGNHLLKDGAAIRTNEPKALEAEGQERRRGSR